MRKKSLFKKIGDWLYLHAPFVLWHDEIKRAIGVSFHTKLRDFIERMSIAPRFFHGQRRLEATVVVCGDCYEQVSIFLMIPWLFSIAVSIDLGIVWETHFRKAIAPNYQRQHYGLTIDSQTGLWQWGYGQKTLMGLQDPDNVLGHAKLVWWCGVPVTEVLLSHRATFTYQQPAAYGYAKSEHELAVHQLMCRTSWPRFWKRDEYQRQTTIRCNDPPRFGSRDPSNPISTDLGIYDLRADRYLLTNGEVAAYYSQRVMYERSIDTVERNPEVPFVLTLAEAELVFH